MAYRVGECVDHVLGGMLGWVRCKGVTAAGTEVYAVELFETNERPLRIMRGTHLVAVPEGSERCRDCVLWVRGRCVRSVAAPVMAAAE